MEHNTSYIAPHPSAACVRAPLHSVSSGSEFARLLQLETVICTEHPSRRQHSWCVFWLIGMCRPGCDCSRGECVSTCHTMTSQIYCINIFNMITSKIYIHIMIERHNLVTICNITQQRLNFSFFIPLILLYFKYSHTFSLSLRVARVMKH